MATRTRSVDVGGGAGLAKASKERPSKIHVLSVVLSIFDPLGLLGFFNLPAKIGPRSNIEGDD